MDTLDTRLAAGLAWLVANMESLASDTLTRAGFTGYHGAAVAPETFEALAAVPRGGSLPIWNGECEHTIYGAPAVNIAFRAWHDAHHLLGPHPFTLDGERDACEAQVSDVRAVCPPDLFPAVAALLRAEIVGQATILAETGAFPTDQVAATMAAARRLLA
jgi:hypothetical protein